MVKNILKIIGLLSLVFLIMLISFVVYRQWKVAQLPEGLEEVADGDAIFWLMQKPTNRFMPCVVNYHFDKPLEETEILTRLKDLVANYQMFRRNVVVADGLPYWQSVVPDWTQNFQVLDSLDNLESIRIKADFDISQASELGQGLPLFRAYLSSNRQQLLFIWHHVLSDFEGMFNKHAKHLFKIDTERTRFGYQMNNKSKEGKLSQSLTGPLKFKYYTQPTRKKGFKKSDFEVKKIVLPISDRELYELGKQADLPMSDIFSFIAMRAVTQYHEQNKDRHKESIRPIFTPLSLRKNSLAIDEGNNRATKEFPLVFPLETPQVMHQRVVSLLPSSGSYESSGKTWKRLRQLSFLEASLIELSSPNYISNYFPLADIPLNIGDANLISHDLRVPMAPYEQTKFAWSNYDGAVQLYLHTDPVLMDRGLMKKSIELAIQEVFQFLSIYKK